MKKLYTNYAKYILLAMVHDDTNTNFDIVSPSQGTDVLENLNIICDNNILDEIEKITQRLLKEVNIEDKKLITNGYALCLLNHIKLNKNMIFDLRKYVANYENWCQIPQRIIDEIDFDNIK